MSRIFEAMVRDGNMTAGEAVVVYAMVAALTGLGIPAKKVITHLMRMVPPAQLSQLQEDFEKILDDMVRPEETDSQRGGQNEDDDRDVRRREIDEERGFDRVDSTGAP